MRLTGWQFVLLNLVLGVAHMVVLFNAASYVALLPHAASNLGAVLPSFGTWAQTDFMIALALSFPLARWLSGQFGRVRVFVTAFVLYALASALCAFGETIGAFLPARILLGIAGGVTLPLGQALLLEEYPDRLKSAGLSIWGLFTLMPFTLGLAYGGWLADEWGWRALFYLNIPVSLMIAGLTWALLAEHSEPRRLRFDAVGFLLFALILGGMQTILNQGNDFDWFDSRFLQAVLVVVLIALPCWIIWELAEEDPVIDVRLFRNRNFTIGLLCLVLGFLPVQGLLALFVVQLQTLMGYSATLAGLVFVPMILFGAPMIAIMHEVTKRVDARWLASLTAVGFAGTFYWIGLFDDPHSYDQIFWPMALEGLFLGMFFAPLTALTLHGLSGPHMLRAAEVANVFRIAAGALGITWQGVVLFRRLPFHQLHLADHFGGRVSVSYDALQEIWAKLEAAGLDPAMIQRKLQLVLKQEAGILALNDAFLLAAYLFLGLAVLVWFAKSTRVPVQPVAEPAPARHPETVMEPA